VLVALVIAGGAASAGTLKERARFRDGPNLDSTLLGVLAAGTEVVVMQDERGWKKISSPDGTVGWIWGDHLAQAPSADAPAATAATPGAAVPTPERPAAPEAPKPMGLRAVAEELRDLRTEVQALRARPEPASAADVERLRSEIDRLVAEQRTLVRRIDEGRYPAANGGDAPAERPFPTALVTLVIGALGGLLVGRIARRRRDRRSRSRLSF
jgi:uncharacterized protein YgiM (DUF1202 family)